MLSNVRKLIVHDPHEGAHVELDTLVTCPADDAKNGGETQLVPEKQQIMGVARDGWGGRTRSLMQQNIIKQWTGGGSHIDMHVHH